jgi:hypothetical protein
MTTNILAYINVHHDTHTHTELNYVLYHNNKHYHNHMI